MVPEASRLVMQQTGKAGSRRQLIAVSAIAALMLGTATFYAVQKLSRDDCMTLTNTMPDGSEITIKACS